MKGPARFMLAVLIALSVTALVPGRVVLATGTVGDVLGAIKSPDPITGTGASSYPGYPYLGCITSVSVDRGANFPTVAALEGFLVKLWSTTFTTIAAQCKSAVDTNQSQIGSSGMGAELSPYSTYMGTVADVQMFGGGCGLSSTTGMSGGPWTGCASFTTKATSFATLGAAPLLADQPQVSYSWTVQGNSTGASQDLGYTLFTGELSSDGGAHKLAIYERTVTNGHTYNSLNYLHRSDGGAFGCEFTANATCWNVLGNVNSSSDAGHPAVSTLFVFPIKTTGYTCTTGIVSTGICDQAVDDTLNGGLVFNVARQSWYWDAVCGTNGIITQPFSGPYPTESAWLGGCSSQNGMGYRWVPGHLGKSVPPDVGQVATCATSSIAGSLIGLDMALTGDQGATCTTPTGVTVPIFKLPVTGPNQEQTQTDILGVLRGILTGLGQLPGKIVDEIKARIIPPLPVAHQTDTVITLNPLTHPNLDPGGVGHVSLFPFSVPWDLKAIASALDVSPTAPSWSLAWKNPLDGSTITTTTIGFTEFCLGSTCFQLLDRDLGAGVTPMVLVRWAELMLLVIGVGLRLRDWMGDGW